MEFPEYSYRNQLAHINQRLLGMMIDLYKAGFQIGLEDEWKYLKHSDGTPIDIPLKMDYLSTAENELVKMIVKMIRIVDEAFTSIQFNNNISIDEILPGQLVQDETDLKPIRVKEQHTELGNTTIYKKPMDAKNSHTDYFTKVCRKLGSLFCDIVKLSGQSLNEEIEGAFDESYLNGSIKLKSEDHNVNYLVDVFNRLMRAMTDTVDGLRGKQK